MDVQKKKLEILDYVFNSKDGCSWNELTEFLNELSDVTKKDSYLMVDATLRRMEKTIETIHPVITSHNEAITDLKHSITMLKHFCGVSL